MEGLSATRTGQVLRRGGRQCPQGSWERLAAYDCRPHPPARNSHRPRLWPTAIRRSCRPRLKNRLPTSGQDNHHWGTRPANGTCRPRPPPRSPIPMRAARSDTALPSARQPADGWRAEPFVSGRRYGHRMSNAAPWAATAGNKFREVARTTENPTTKLLAEGLTALTEAPDHSGKVRDTRRRPFRRSGPGRSVPELRVRTVRLDKSACRIPVATSDARRRLSNKALGMSDNLGESIECLTRVVCELLGTVLTSSKNLDRQMGRCA